MATPVTPQAGIVSQVTTGGTAVTVIPASPSGGFITNPSLGADQNIGGGVEYLYVDPVGTAALASNGTTSGLAPGQSYTIIPGQTTSTSVNAATSGHKFTVVWYP